MRGELFAGVAASLRSAGVNLVTWDQRGSPGPGDPRDCKMEDHVADGLAVLAALGLGQVHVAGWCIGASIAVFLARELGSQALSFTAVDGVYLFDGVPGGAQGKAIFDMCVDIAADPGRAPRYHDAVRPRGNEAAVMGLDGHPELVQQLTYPYRQGVDGLVRYAHAIRTMTDYEVTGPCVELTCPALFTARREDQIVGFRHSQRAAALVPGAQFHLADGGHYGLFVDREAPLRMAEFMRASAR
jgi:pimeloyl-ACP methyl ester carboxylesterase